MTSFGPEAPCPRQLRLFIAIPLPDKVREEIAAAQSRFHSTLCNARIAWTKPEQLHLTLKFLGNVPAERVDLLKRELRVVCGACGPMALRAAGVGFFPERGEPRVVWVGIGDETGRLASLHTAIESATREFSAETSGDKFVGHVTVGRVKRITRIESEMLKKIAAGMAGGTFGEWLPGKIGLMRSELTPDGARHETLADFRLG